LLASHAAFFAVLVAGLFAVGGIVLYRGLRAGPAQTEPSPPAAVQAATLTTLPKAPPCKPEEITLSVRVEPWLGGNLITVEAANSGPACADTHGGLGVVILPAPSGSSGIWFSNFAMQAGEQPTVQLAWRSDCASVGKRFDVRANLGGRQATAANVEARGCLAGNSGSLFPAEKLDVVNGVPLAALPSCHTSRLTLQFAQEPASGAVVVSPRISNNAAPCRLRGSLSIEVLDAGGRRAGAVLLNPDAVPVYVDLDRELTATAFAWENWCGTPGKFTMRLALGALSASSEVDAPGCGDPGQPSQLRSTPGASALAPDRAIVAPTPSPQGSSTALSGDPTGGVAITCRTRTYGWARPSLDEMRGTTFKVPRFLDGGTLFPALFAMYLSHVSYIEVPWANSARIEPAAMSGISVPAAGRETFGPCRYEPGRGPTEVYSEFWLAGYRPIEVRIRGDEAVISVEADPGTFQTFDIERPAIIDPKSPANAPISMPAHLSLIRVVDNSGRLLFEQDGFLNWWEVDGSGRLIVANLDARSEVPSEPRIDGRENPGELAVYSSGSASGPATLKVLDRSGTVLASYGLAAAAKAWQRLATFTLPPQAVTLHLDAGANVLILGTAQELP
jgi:hypothetical protein